MQHALPALSWTFTTCPGLCCPGAPGTLETGGEQKREVFQWCSEE